MFNNRVEWKIELLKYQLQSEKQGYFDLKIECLDGYFLAHRIVFAASTTLEWSTKKSMLRETLVVKHTLEEVSKILFLAYTGEIFLKDTLSYLDDLVKSFQFNEDKLSWRMPYNVVVDSKPSYNLSQRKVRACRQCVPSDNMEADMKEVFIYENGHVEYISEIRESSSFVASEYFIDVGYPCKYCSCVFMESIQLEEHKGTCLPPVKQEVLSPPLACQVKEEFTGTSNVTPICMKASLAPRRVVSTSEVVCPSCGYENNSVMKLVQHYDEVHGIKPSRDYCMKPVKCKKCPFFRKRLPMSTFLNHVFNCKVAAVNNSQEILDCLLQDRSPFTSSLVLQNSPNPKKGYKTPKRNHRKREKLGGEVNGNRNASPRQNASRKSQKQLKIETVNIELVSHSKLLENPEQPFREHYSTEPPETNHIKTTPMNKSRVQLRKNALPVKKIDFLQVNAAANSKWEKDCKIESCQTNMDTNQLKIENKRKEDSALSNKAALMENATLSDKAALIQNATLSDNVARMENVILTDNVALMENATLSDKAALMENAKLSDIAAAVKNYTLSDNVAVMENAILTDNAALMETAILTDNVTKITENANLSKDLFPVSALLSTHEIDENENNNALATHLESQYVINAPETSLGEIFQNSIKKQARIPSFLKKSLMYKKRRLHEIENPNISNATDATKNEETMSDKIETRFTKTICGSTNRNCYVISRNHGSPGKVLNTSSLFINQFPFRMKNNYKIPKKLTTSGAATQPADMPLTSIVSNLQRTPKRKLSSSPEEEKGVTKTFLKPRPWKRPKIERLALGRARFKQLTNPNTRVSLDGHKKPSHVWSCNYCRQKFNNQILYMRHSCQLSCPK